jgi:hypothetical protein
MRGHRRSVAALIAVLALGAVAAPVTAGGPRFAFSVMIGDGCVSGTGLRDARHHVSLYASSGTLKDHDRVTSVGRAFTACFFQPVLGRDRLVVEAGGERRAFRVPALVPAIDRVTDAVTGHAGPGTVVDLTLFHSEGFAPGEPVFRQAAVDAGGDYSADFSDIDIVGADQVQAAWTNGHDTVATYPAYAPFITYGRVSSTVVGAARRGQDVRIELIDRDGDVRGVAHGGMPTVFQFFESVLIDGNGDDVYPMRGDRVVAPFTGDADLRVPRMFLAPRPDRDRVAGACMPHSPYQLWVFYGQLEPVVRIGVTDEEGEFSRSVGIDLRRGHYMTLNCRYATGDFVFMDQEV